MTTPDPYDHATLQAEAGRVASRFWAERAKGNTVSVEDVLEVPPDSQGYEALKASAMRAIAQYAATLAGSSADAPPQTPAPASISDAATIVGSARAHNPEDSIVAGGPLPVIEGYELISCLGRGGMGAVFEGYQQSTGRRVALKFMLDSAGSSESARKRFEREVEVVARLQHPGIVSVVDSGVRKGRYYYVMEYVAGRALDAALPPGQCPARQSLTLMAQVCDAVDYAHQHGVLHRDLKPSNIIVDAKGLPHLLDFGLAKVFDPASKTSERHGAMGLTVSGPGQLMGTVAYMSPEQAHGKHDETSVRTDVYSLGAIAYELLTGKLPSDTSGSLGEVLERITRIDPAAPSTVRQGLTRDLDAVILKSLDKDPEKRYATAGEFGADIRRSLAGEPVQARRVSTAGRAWRWIGRNQAISAVSLAAAITLVVVSTFLLWRVVSESKIAARERDLAQENFNRLRTMLDSADPEKNPGITILQMLDSATKGLDESPPVQPLVEAQIREVLGNVYRKFADYPRARDHLTKALALRERVAAGKDDPRLGDALHNLAASLWWDGAYDQAEKYYVRALDMRRRLSRQHDDPQVALSLTHLAACYLRTGKLGQARSLYKEALAMRQRLHTADPKNEEVAQSLNNLAKCYLEADDFPRAESLFNEALTMIRQVKGDSYNGTAAASQNLAESLLRRAEAAQAAGDHAGTLVAADSAKEALDRALAIRTTAYPNGHHLLGTTLASMARAQVLRGEVGAAEQSALRAVEMLHRFRRADHPDLAEGLGALGIALRVKGDGPGAVAALEEALTIAEHAKPPSEAQIARIRGDLGMALALTNRPDDAEKALLQSLSQMRAFRGDDSLDTTIAARHLADFYTLVKQPDKAAQARDMAKSVPASAPASVR